MNPWDALLELLGNILAFFYNIIPNYGIAIIGLTLLLNLVLFPLTLKQTRSMKAMQEIQPEVKRLQKEYKEDREELQKQMMELYRERGVNPAAGCLPLLVQMPIWFALFRVLRLDTDPGAATLSESIPNDSSLYRALESGDSGFLGMDMLIAPSESIAQGIVSAIPYIILILIVVGAGYYQQAQTTRRRGDSPQPEQLQGMQTAMKIMPVFFGVISWTFPAGLVLYFAASNLFRIVQQWFILRLDEGRSGDGEAEEKAGQPEASSGGGAGAVGDEPKKRRAPSPHASKKRTKRRRK